MKKLLIIFSFLFVSSSLLFAQTDIADARTYAQGATVTITGTVTSGPSLGGIRYIQDATAGIGFYDPGVTGTWDVGYNVTITGVMGAFNGAIQIVNSTSAVVNNMTDPEPTPQVLLPTEIGPANESELIKVEDVTFADQGGVFGSGTYSFQNGSGQSSVIYIRGGHPLEGTLIPLGTVNLTGISAQFNGAPQMLLRDANDMEISASFFVTTDVNQSNITTSSFDIDWETNLPGVPHARYGLTESYELGSQSFGGMTTAATGTLSGLTDATIYNVQAYSVDGADTAWAANRVYSTQSLSTGEIKVFFNFPVDVSVSTGTNAKYLSPSSILDSMIYLIDNAQQTIDVAVYNNNRNDLAAALLAAHNRGVTVRYVYNLGTLNSAINPPPAYNTFGVNPTNLMHNKFMVVDAELEDDSWVLTGSMNWTDNNVADDPNNLIMIQDQAVARTYVKEFNEMWGGSGPSPGIFTSLSGEFKKDDTPHQFIVNGNPFEVYFSPSDNTTIEIADEIDAATTSVDFALLSFTNNTLGGAVAGAFFAGLDVRGIIESTSDAGTEYDYFVSIGLPIQDHPESYQLHHKYVVIDDAVVATGSHNWSNSAENSNDENTVIVHDPVIANQYTQEFTARWLGMNTGIPFVGGYDNFEVSFFPNPATSFTQIEIDSKTSETVTLMVIDSKGSILSERNLEVFEGKHQYDFNLNTLSPGTYFIGFKLSEFGVARKLVVVK